jgi:hypothetical protein
MPLNVPHECEVILEIVSQVLTLAELQRRLMIKGDIGSRSLGDVLPRGGQSSQTILKISSGADAHSSLHAHLEAICQRIPADRLRLARPDVDVVFSIAVYFETAYATLLIEPRSGDLIRAYSASIEVVSYPSQNDERPNRGDP